MKKIISLMMSISIVFSCIVITTTNVSAEQTTLFELDIPKFATEHGYEREYDERFEEYMPYTASYSAWVNDGNPCFPEGTVMDSYWKMRGTDEIPISLYMESSNNANFTMPMDMSGYGKGTFTFKMTSYANKASGWWKELIIETSPDESLSNATFTQTGASVESAVSNLKGTVYTRDLPAGTKWIRIREVDHNGGYWLAIENMTVKAHKHNLSVTASGNKLTAQTTCAGESDCNLTSNPSGTVTVTATSKTFDGKAAMATVTPDSNWSGFAATPTIEYIGVDDTKYDASKKAPAAIGKYRAQITINSATAYQEFEIKPIAVAMTSEDQDNFPSIQGGVDGGLGTLRFIWRFKFYGTPTIDNYGAYIIPFDLFSEHQSTSAIIKYDNLKSQPKEDETFSADIVGIPEDKFDVNIYAIPFINEVLGTATLLTNVNSVIE